MKTNILQYTHVKCIIKNEIRLLNTIEISILFPFYIFKHTFKL